MPARVVLAMSGGVDSSVAALLLKEQGYDVVGLFMRTGVHEDVPSPPTPLPEGARGAGTPLPQVTRDDRKKGCCSALDAGDARRVADRLDIPFYALDFEGDFSRIMDYFADEYLAGRTPNPCVVCNNWLKFGKLWDYGRQLDADFIATGHYVRAVDQSGERQLLRAVDPAKDQSYVLFGLRRELLPRLLFPLGAYHKDEVRALARHANLGVAAKPDSVEICFVPNNDHADFIRKHRPNLATAGVFRDRAGNVLAEHEGYEKYTIGQRKGLGFGSTGRRYVLEIVPETRDVILGDRDDLLSAALTATRVNWLIDPPARPLPCRAKIRYRHEPAAAAATVLTNGDVRVDFETPQSAITPGQAVVFYAGERILGGGWIESTVDAPPVR
ncbi:MAG: tRNA 2-thiouridine(34) synthase MnmA [Gemmataceae bacterium]|nr:tRNA 2-thiouridine(34) synthase MnmA [Gemmataceae bacterium]